MVLSTSSSIVSLLFTGRIINLLNPWHLIINFDEETITVKKRNWYLIGVDQTIAPFKYVRRIDIDAHLFGADLILKVYGSGTLQVNSIPKSDTRKIKRKLIDYNNSGNKKINIMY